MFHRPSSSNPTSPKCCKCVGLWPSFPALHTCTRSPTHASVYTYTQRPTHTNTHNKQFTNMPLNGTTKYRRWFHKSCGWRSRVLPVPATGDKSALCVLFPYWLITRPSLLLTKEQQTQRKPPETPSLRPKPYIHITWLPLRPSAPQTFLFLFFFPIWRYVLNLDLSHVSNKWPCFRCSA